MADFAKRPEITVNTMGKVHNPTGEGVRAISSTVQAKAAAAASKQNGEEMKAEVNGSNGGVGSHSGGTSNTATLPSSRSSNNKDGELHETKVKEGTAKRNITRKKTADKDSGNYNSTFKKQGGHGKGQWKEMMDPSYTIEIPMDENDPLYDQVEDSTKFILTSHSQASEMRGYDPSTSKAIYGPLLTLSEFKVQLRTCLEEYYDSCDTDEVIRTLKELGCQEYHAEIVKKSISLALDKGSRERELTSRLLTCLHPTPLSLDDLQTGFIILLDSLDDICTDVPDATTMVASFLARAVVDEVLAPAFLSEQNNQRPGDPVIEKAISLLNREHCTARLERVWGPGDGRPVEELKKDMDQLMQEYLLSRELDEAARCVRELEAPHFHHELVKRGVFAAMELDGKKTATDDDALSNIDAMAALFGFLVSNVIVSENQVKKGVDRLHKVLPDLVLDVPAAPALLEAFEKFASEKGCLHIPSNGKSSEKEMIATSKE